MTYDGAERMTALEDANGGVSRFGYDNADNILWIEDPLADFYPNERHQVDFTYDDRGNQKTFKDAMSNLTSFDYDTMNNLTRVVDAADSTTTYEYDPNFNLSKVIDARGKATRYDYDLNDRLSAVTDPLLKTVVYRYDKVGNTSDTVYPNGNETYYDYFKDHLLKKVWYKAEATSYDFRYNPTHTLKDVTDQSGRAWSFGYDAGDRLTTTTENINSSYGDFIINRSYDGVFHLTGIKAPGETTTSYTYNARDDLTDIDLPGGAVDEIGFGYDDGRNRTSIAMPGNVGNIFKLDPAGRVTTVTVDTASDDSAYLYAHDANGNVTRMAENTWAGAVTEYKYDELNRLTDWYNPASDTTTTYSYDKTGNLTSVKEGAVTTQAFSYNAANQISSPGYGYDENGNMTETSLRASGASAAIPATLVYDAENRLKEVRNKATNDLIVSYTYDFMGRRIAAADSSGNTTFFHYDGWNVVAESDNSGNVTARYYYDQSGQIMAMKRDGQTYYYQFNAHGDVVSLTNSSGQVVNSYQYDPWGNHLAVSELVENPFRYAGYRWDEETGLYYLRARYYDAGIKRFLTRDPDPGRLRNPQTLNRYIYVGNNPVNRIDPSGEWWVALANPYVALGVLAVAASVALYYGIQKTITDLNGASSASISSPAVYSRVNSPSRGEPNSWGSYGNTWRKFGPCGKAKKDVDYGHDHGAGDPHVHDWDWTKRPPRQGGKKARAPKPGELDEIPK